MALDKVVFIARGPGLGAADGSRGFAVNPAQEVVKDGEKFRIVVAGLNATGPELSFMLISLDYCYQLKRI